jgi:hypothetical protein
VGVAEKRARENSYPGFNWVAVQDAEGIALHFDGALRTLPFGAGTHVISSDRDLDDPSMPEKRLFDRTFGSGLPGPAEIQGFLRSHEGERPVCKHHDRFGTVSSALYWAGSPARFLFADGPPCQTPFEALRPWGAGPSGFAGLTSSTP